MFISLSTTAPSPHSPFCFHLNPSLAFRAFFVQKRMEHRGGNKAGRINPIGKNDFQTNRKRKELNRMSSSRIAFNKVVVDSTAISGSEFVSGSGLLSLRGNDKSVATADGIIHYFRISLTPELSFQVFGDKISLSSPPGEAVSVSVYQNEKQIYAFQGLVTVTRSSDPALSTISISGNPEF